MSDPQNPPTPESTPPTPLRCFIGALVAGGLGTAAYFLTTSIATTFANKPPTGSALAVNISIAVRTLVVGTSTLATALFGITALGLVALGIQVMIKGADGVKSEE
jgi:hypothetical protein